jgi:hypothetical protein
MTTPMPGRSLYRYTLDPPGHGRLDVVAFLSPEDLEGLGGLPGRAIVARMRDPEGGLGRENLEWNGGFLQLLHEVVRDHFPALPETAALALGPEAEHVYVRVTRPGRTGVRQEPGDVIGRFAVRDGALDAASYQPHEGFEPVSGEGLFLMHPDLERALLAAIAAAPDGA